MFASRQRKLQKISPLRKPNITAIKISVQDTERVIKDFAETTLLDETQSDATQMQLIQIEGIQSFLLPRLKGQGETDAGDNIVTQKQFLTLEAK